jgi:penicillin amidase
MTIHSKPMATQPASLPQSTSNSGFIIKLVLSFLAFVLVILLIIAGLGALWFDHVTKASLPQVDGNIELSGVKAPVTVIRDAQGVPHISASSLDDLLFAQGYVTAQDRLWQMDMGRRFGRGELSEVIGESTLKLDKQQRTLRLQDAVNNAIAAASPRDIELVKAYAAGVNAYMEGQQNNWPIEFRILGYTPRKWTIEDSLTIGVNISQTLNSQWQMEYSRSKLIAHLKPEEIADLYPNASWRDHPPTMEAPPQVIPPPKPAGPQTNLAVPNNMPRWLAALVMPNMSSYEPCEECISGSNNWVVSGAHTASGKPLLSNDMHLAHSIPNTWYEVQMKAEDYDVFGVSFPGLPYIIAGHNEHVAWGFTNIGPDVQDLFIETFNANGEYQTPKGWIKPDKKHEVIKVKGTKDVELDVLITRHGPIVSDLFPNEPKKYALKWTLYDPAAISLPFLEIGRTKNWQEFTTAFSHFGGPGQNVVYADVDGHIGYHATGKTPIRATGDGLLPVAGNDDAHEWTGYIPFDKLPSTFDPPGGIIGTANGRIAPDGYPFSISTMWGSPYRTERIYKMLNSKQKLTADDMLSFQMDNYSEYDRLCANAYVYAIDHTPNASARTKQAADLMRGWDGHVVPEAVAPVISVKSNRKLWQMILEPKLGNDWDDYSWFMSAVAMEKILQDKPARWLPKGFKDYNELLTAAVEKAVSTEVEQRKPSVGDVERGMANKIPPGPPAPQDLKSWTWGKTYPIELNHLVLGKIPIVNRWSGPGVQPQSGNGSLTVKAAGRTFGASERATYDLSDLDRSTFNLVTGESGHIASQHYMDQWNAWHNGKTFTVPFSEGAVKSSAKNTLMLVPKK